MRQPNTHISRSHSKTRRDLSYGNHCWWLWCGSCHLRGLSPAVASRSHETCVCALYNFVLPKAKHAQQCFCCRRIACLVLRSKRSVLAPNSRHRTAKTKHTTFYIYTDAKHASHKVVRQIYACGARSTHFSQPLPHSKTKPKNRE